jgi:UPF0042 nucleotide-binding protein
MEILIISGLSGPGKSRVAAVLEDLGYYCVDNMPVALMPKFAELCLATRGRYERVALVTDVRTIENLGELFVALDEMRSMGCDHRIVFVEAGLETIVKRYKETRRRHPLAPDGGDLENAVRPGDGGHAPVRDRADVIIDTTDLTLGRLQRGCLPIFNRDTGEKPMSVSVISFGYKYGIPIEADLVRTFVFSKSILYRTLRELSGLDESVRDYINQFDQTAQVQRKAAGSFLSFLSPLLCGGGQKEPRRLHRLHRGRHRSVAIAQALSDYLSDKGYSVDCTHRDLKRHDASVI